MTNEEAIDLLDDLIGMVEDNHNSNYDTALQIAIKALEQEPCIQEKQANADKIDAVYIDGFKAGYSQARFDLEQEPCEDAISREAALDAIGKAHGDIAEAEDNVRALPSVQPISRWIPVSERLPELGEYVLATSSWGDITMAERWDENKWFIHEGSTNGTDEDVIAWMPLPKAYESEEQA